MGKITAIIRTKNCENRLCNILESIKDLDEIIILDEHSVDDTIEIAKEYKTKIIYYLKPELNNAFNEAVMEASNDWIFIADDDEIIPVDLLSVIKNYPDNPKKNKFALCLSEKIFYLDSELKSQRIKQTIRLFKKGYCELDQNGYTLRLTNGKMHNYNKNFKNPKGSIYKYVNPDIIERLSNDLDEIKLSLKLDQITKCGIVRKFLYNYFIKGAFLDGKKGFIFAFYKTVKYFILKVSIFERDSK